jgi:hypothetical protein
VIKNKCIVARVAFKVDTYHFHSDPLADDAAVAVERHLKPERLAPSLVTSLVGDLQQHESHALSAQQQERQDMESSIGASVLRQLLESHWWSQRFLGISSQATLTSKSRQWCGLMLNRLHSTSDGLPLGILGLGFTSYTLALLGTWTYQGRRNAGRAPLVSLDQLPTLCRGGSGAGASVGIIQDDAP